MVDSEILIRGGDVVDGTGAPARRADVRVRGDEIVEVGADLAVDGANDDRRDRRGGDARASSTPTATPTRRCSGTRTSTPIRCTA